MMRAGGVKREMEEVMVDRRREGLGGFSRGCFKAERERKNPCGLFALGRAMRGYSSCSLKLMGGIELEGR